MSDDRLLTIVNMANQIAFNLEHGKEQEQCVAEIASHIQRFWAPTMRKQLIEAIELGEYNIAPLVSLAAQQIRC